MMKKGKVKAMRNGRVGYFSARAWSMGNAHKQGWKICGEVDEADNVPVEEVPIEKIEVKTVEIPKDEGTTEGATEGVNEYPSDDKIREFLNDLADKGKIKRPHHATGTKKLRALYDENTK